MSNDNREKLYRQIIEQHGKIVYSCTTDEKEIELISLWTKFRQIVSIILSAVTVSPAFPSLFNDSQLWKIFSAIAGIILLSISSYNLKSNSEDKIEKLKESANSLWIIRERYVSLLTDFDYLTTEQIRSEREELILEVAKVYKKRPKTSHCAYKRAQRALKNEEEQTFYRNEAELLLPSFFREEL